MKFSRVAVLFLSGAVLFACGIREAWGNTAGTVIATPDNPESCTLDAAMELASILGRAYGEKPEVVREKEIPAGGNVIFIGETAAARKAGLSAEKLENQAFRLKSVPGGLCILGGTPLGTLYGMYEFLQRCCDIWYVAPGAEFIGTRRMPALSEIDLTLSPAIKSRRIYHAGYTWRDRKTREQWYEFDRRNRISSEGGECPSMKPYLKYREKNYVVSTTPGRAIHNFYDYLSPGDYAKEHPEYFSMNRDGVRDWRRNAGGQLCLSNPEVFKIVLRHLEKSIARDRAADPDGYPRVYDFSQEDNTNYICCCPECAKIIRKYGDSDAGLLLWFVNRLARAIREKYPDVLIRTYAYVSTGKIPSGIRAEDNVIIQYCDLYAKCNNLHSLTHPVNRERMELMKAWSKHAEHLMVWDYILQSGDLPLNLVDAIPADAKFFRDNRIDWIFMETEFRNEGASFVHLKNFVLAQFYFNPDQNLEKLIDVHCRAWFGKAHAEMKEYLAYLGRMQAENPTSDMAAWHRRDLRHITPEMLRTCRAMIRKAFSRERDPVIHLRILAEQNAVDRALVRALRPNPAHAEERKALKKNLTANRIRVIDSCGFVKRKRDAIVKEIRDQEAEESLVFHDLPPQLAEIPKERIRFLGSSRLSSGGRNAKLAMDPDSTMPRVLVWTNPNPEKFTETIGCGVYDQKWKKNFPSTLQAGGDEKYHWQHVGRISLGPASRFYALDWQAGIRLDGFFLISDGAQEDPNSYDLWVSVKFQGPAYCPGSKKQNAVLFDRAMLVR